MTLHCEVAKTQRQLDDALRVRWTVFGEELGLVAGPRPVAPREVSPFDTLETTTHVLVYADGRPVATARLLLPNREVAETGGGRLGIDLETKYEVSPLVTPELRLAETTCFCILKDWRGSEAVMHLVAGLYQESLRHGVTHWVASANMETDWLEDARIAYRVAAHLGLVSDRWQVRSRAQALPPSVPTAPLYVPAARERARGGELHGLRLPRTLSLFARKIGARFIGAPLYDSHFRRYALPLVAPLDSVPAEVRVPPPPAAPRRAA
jgi:putative hemolysin